MTAKLFILALALPVPASAFLGFILERKHKKYGIGGKCFEDAFPKMALAYTLFSVSGLLAAAFFSAKAFIIAETAFFSVLLAFAAINEIRLRKKHKGKIQTHCHLRKKSYKKQTKEAD
ncbi:MAG: hypothetical protein K5838_06655 [Elusimicrobiales bacterium]|nr:hypothetical protein [Elusimicrobiales bacterium]